MSYNNRLVDHLRTGATIAIPTQMFQDFDARIGASASIPDTQLSFEDLYPGNIPAQRRAYQDQVGKWAAPRDYLRESVEKMESFSYHYPPPLPAPSRMVSQRKRYAPKRHHWYHTLLWLFMFHKHIKNADLVVKEPETSSSITQE